MQTSPFRYRSLAELLAEELNAGRYPAGTQLPSVRQLCQAYGASLSTVTRALHELEDAGRIEARSRRGFFARAVAARTLPSSAPAVAALALSGRRQRLMALAAIPPDCLSLGHLGLAPALLPVAGLKRLLGQQLADEPAQLAAGMVFGSDELRAQLARRAPRMGCRFDAEDVVVSHGEGESLQLCLRLLARPGERVAVLSPAPLRALELAASMGLELVEVPSGPTPAASLTALAAVLAEPGIVACVAEPAFPCAAAASFDDAAKKALVALLARHRVPLIECDMMGELHRGACRPLPLKAFDEEDWVLYCGSLACITGPGFSIGYVASARYRLQLRAARSVHGELLPLLHDRVLAAFLAGGGFEQHLRRLRQCLQAQLADWQAAVRAAFPAGTRVHTGETGYALWLELPLGLDACVLLERARAQGYNFVPGAVFGLGTQFDHCLRLAAAHPLDAVRERGIRLLGAEAKALLRAARRTRPARAPSTPAAQ